MTPKPNSILVVDDEVDTCANLSDIFTELGFQVDVAHDGLRALELVRKRHYDIALLDLKMPGMDGLEATRLIRQNPNLQPVIIAMTANAMKEDKEACLQAGMDDYISKPIRMEQLVQTLSKWSQFIQDRKKQVS